MKQELKFEWFDNPDEIMIILKENIIPKVVGDLKILYLKKQVKRNTYRKLRHQLNHKRPIRIKSLKKILILMNINFSNFNEHIKAFSSNKYIYPVNLPLNLDRVESAILVAAFMSDGNNNDKHPFYANVGFLGDKIIRAAQDIMPSITFEIRNEKTRFQPTLSRILLKLDVPIGNKTKLNPKIPEWIYNNIEYKKAYLTQVFDDEGHAATRGSRKIVLGRSVAVHSLPSIFAESLVYKEKNYYNSLPEEVKNIVKLQPPNLIVMEFDLLNEFNIKSSLRCRGLTKYLETISADWVIEIAGIENLNRFHREIGFSHPEKIKQMEDYLKTCRKDKNFMRVCIK